MKYDGSSCVNEGLLILKNRNEYNQRIYKAQDYICAHLDQKLNLERLAEVSAFSPFHFHRIFKKIAGETLFSFIQRIRLEKSCAMLTSRQKTKIISIALRCGFSTSSAFSKSFKKHYKISPTEYRDYYSLKKSKNGILDSNIGGETAYSNEYISVSELESLYRRRNNMDVRIENIPEYRIAYMRQIGPYGPNNIQLMQKLKKWAISRDLLNDSATILGIAHDNPEVTPPNNCRYDCGIVLSETYDLEQGINETTLPGGKYAIFSLEHTAEALLKAWNEIFSTWLPDSKYQISARPVFERYTGSTVDVKIEPDFCELCIPIERV